MALPGFGVLRPEVYDAATQISQGGAGTPWAGDTITTAHQFLNGLNGGTTTPTVKQSQPAPDPYAKWGGRSAYQGQIDSFNNQKNVINDTTNSAINTSYRDLNRGITDYLSDYGASQKAINNQSVDAELAKIMGGRDIQGMVGRGIRSGATMLANKNASDSSAAGAIAQAYGDIGNREMNKVGGQYSGTMRDIQTNQDELGRKAGLFRSGLDVDQDNSVDGIVNAATQSLSALDAQIADADLPNRIAIQQEQARIRNEAVAKLNALDAVFDQGRAKHKQVGEGDRIAQASQRSIEGVSPDKAFDYSTSAPAQFQNTGPYNSQLPLFTFPRSDKER